MQLGAFLLFFQLLTDIEGSLETSYLQILPSGPQEVRRGKNLVLTCRATAHNLELIRDLRWFDPNGEPIPQNESLIDYHTRMYGEEQPGEAATALFIKQVSNRDAGTYTCRAVYAANKHIEASVQISVYVGITWDDTPVEQFATLGGNYKIRCKVRAEPAANIDWLNNGHVIASGGDYVIENDGLLIQRVKKNSSATYTCRARVPQTGELEERDVRLEVIEPPVWLTKPMDVVGVEAERAEFQCRAEGQPLPQYSWVGPDGQDPTSKDGWKLLENSGTLVGYQVYGKDRGEYKCIAENSAGRIEAYAYLSVVIRPRVEELQNATYRAGEQMGQLRCLASGQPLPSIIWRKESQSESMVMGVQPNDPRLVVVEHIIRAPDYTSQGEIEWVESVLSINDIKRLDDGLYECQAKNPGGSYFKSGHITVEFPPTFEDQVIQKDWSWDLRPVNLTCIATSIPNATITWWDGVDIVREIGREDLDQNLQIIGRGPESFLNIRPLSAKYYRKYKCRAQNYLGQADYFIELEEAREPGVINQAVLEKQTATSLAFRFVPPSYVPGLPVDSYAVEYKEARTEWIQAKRRVWPAGEGESVYIVEELVPFTTYDLRFSCRNRVGFSPWGATKQITTSRRGKPEPPVINREKNMPPQGSQEDVGTEAVNESRLPHDQEISWQIPHDNGVPVDHYLITISLVRRDGLGWREVGGSQQVEVPNRGTVRWSLKHLNPDSFYKISVQAHNEIGYSEKDTLVIRTPPGAGLVEGEVSLVNPEAELQGLPLLPILVAVLVLVLILLVLIDLSCCKLYQKGVLYITSQKFGLGAKMGRRNKRGKPVMSGQNIINNYSIAGSADVNPLLSKPKTTTSVVTTKRGTKTKPNHHTDYLV